MAESVFVVQTYVAEADFHARLDAVIAYVKAIKQELQQEAMAVEIDHRLVLL